MIEQLAAGHLAGLEEALEHGGNTHGIEHVLGAIRRGSAQLWIQGDNCLVTQVLPEPRALVLHFWLACGTLDGTIDLSNKVMEWGREQGCSVATLAGRSGWARALKAEGWNHQLVLMGKKLL